MIHSVRGNISAIIDQFAVVDTGGVGYKVFTHKRALGALRVGEEACFFCHLHIREDLMDLYGFTLEEELELFEQLISISGVGPRSALAIMEISDLPGLIAAIQENRPDLLVRASGVGRKTAERIVLELRNKVKTTEAGANVRRMEADSDLIETLVNLGYRREQARAALERVSKETSGLENRLKAAFKILSGK